MCIQICKETDEVWLLQNLVKVQLKARKRDTVIPPDQKHHVICNFLYQETAAAQF